MDCADPPLFTSTNNPVQAVKILRSNVEIIFFPAARKVSSAYVTAELRCPVRRASCALEVESTGPRGSTLALQEVQATLAIKHCIATRG
jgi:hypothetical protein